MTDREARHNNESCSYWGVGDFRKSSVSKTNNMNKDLKYAVITDWNDSDTFVTDVSGMDAGIQEVLYDWRNMNHIKRRDAGNAGFVTHSGNPMMYVVGYEGDDPYDNIVEMFTLRGIIEMKEAEE